MNDGQDDYDDDASTYDDYEDYDGSSRISAAKMLLKETKTMGSMIKYYRWQYAGALLLVSAHLGIMYGRWRIGYSRPPLRELNNYCTGVDVPPWKDYDGKVHQCGRGVLTPPCNAASLVDKWIFTLPHM